MRASSNIDFTDTISRRSTAAASLAEATGQPRILTKPWSTKSLKRAVRAVQGARGKQRRIME
jgi:hypothetical protein